MLKLENTLRPYAWGSHTAIAELFGREPSGSPEAELWIGAHPDSPSMVVHPDGRREPLDRLIAHNPEAALGTAAVAAFGPRLPFLAKVLAAGAPLSLQVHPTPAQASEGFAAENRAGVPADAPHRNYRDDNHKPEMILALTPFEALCGFREPEAAADLFQAVAELGVQAELLTEISSVLRGPGSVPQRLETVFRRLIEGGPDVSTLVDTGAAAVHNAVAAETPLPAELVTLAELAQAYPGDPGVLISLMLNRVSLQPGQAVYLPAGNVHAYLRGLGVEVMAASDNVLRGGLTPKHVDIPELIRTIEFEALGIPFVSAEFTGLDQELYRPPFREFQLQRIELPSRTAGDGADRGMAASDQALAQHGPAVVLVVRGSVVLDSPKGDLVLTRGESAFIPAVESPVIVKPAAGTDIPGQDDGALVFAVTVSGR